MKKKMQKKKKKKKNSSVLQHVDTNVKIFMQCSLKPF